MRVSPRVQACGPTGVVGRARNVNLILNCEASQPDPHFASQNIGQAKTGRADPLCHP